ncbi:hypothetical protein C1645_840934 [Glomus cerebriforme]|uniref:Uncharacterized protein n=1 Tax=Glomus cerebriforme TaxID=658196 RepID=A0A397RYL4_9GLOM|nr:hypothetical protein C1645_840934 [Glomus cerebriforme]
MDFTDINTECVITALIAVLRAFRSRLARENSFWFDAGIRNDSQSRMERKNDFQFDVRIRNSSLDFQINSPSVRAQKRFLNFISGYGSFFNWVCSWTWKTKTFSSRNLGLEIFSSGNLRLKMFAPGFEKLKYSVLEIQNQKRNVIYH